MIRVCTGFGPAGFVEYGGRFLDTFDRFWPRAVELVAYTEEAIQMPRGQCRSLWDIPGARDFYERHKDDLATQGRAPCPKWGNREYEKSAASAAKGVQYYDYKFDALKFFRQCLIPLDASLDMQDGDILTWLDGDVVTLKPMPLGFVDMLLFGSKFDLCYLGRVKKRMHDPDGVRGAHSEIGFWAVRLNPQTRRFLESFADAWTTDRFKTYAEWHSAYVFDVTRMAMIDDLHWRDLTGGARRGREGGHVWHNQSSPLSKYMDHLKGDRKRMERSPEARYR